MLKVVLHAPRAPNHHQPGSVAGPIPTPVRPIALVLPCAESYDPVASLMDDVSPP